MLKVNVLSPADKLIFRYERARILVQRFSIRVIFIVLLFAVALLPSYFQTVFQQQEFSRQQENLAKSPEQLHVSEIDREVDSANKLISQLKGLFEAERQTTGMRFSALSKVLPARIRLQSLRISAEGASVAGVAETREDVVSVASALQNLDFVASVNSPISNIVREKNNQFRIDVKFK